MRSIIAWSMQLRLLVLAAAAVLMFFGATQLRTMPVDVLPEFSRPYVEIQTEALGLSAPEVESMITVPLEADMLNGAPWVDEIRSESIPGLSSIVMFFEPGVDMLTARQVVQERLVAVHALPAVSKPPAMLQPVSSSNRFMAIGMSSDTHSLIDMSVMARWTIVPRLTGVPGVAHVSIWGQRKRQLQVQVDPETLRDHGVTLNQIIRTTGNALWASPLTFLDASTPGTGGWIETPNQRLTIQHLLPISTPADLAKVTVYGTTLPLGAVAQVVVDHQPLIGDAVIDKNPNLMLVLEKFPGVNTVEVTKAVEEAVAALELGLTGVEMDTTYFRPATYLDLVVENLSLALLVGSVLLMAGLFAALHSWRSALVAAVAVGVSGLAAISVLAVMGVTLNAMVIAGLMVALVALVDDVVIDSQNIARRLRERTGDDEASTAKTIFAAAFETRRPILYAMAIVALGVAPLLLLESMVGHFATPIVHAYGLALLASLVTAFTVTPALSLLLLGGAPAPAGSPILDGLQKGFEGVLAATTAAPARALGGAVAVLGLVVAAGLWTTRTDVVIPTFLERDVVITVDGAPGTSGHAMRRVVGRMSEDLRGIDGVRSVSAHVGRAVMSDKVNDIHGGEVWANISRAADYDATLAAIRAVAENYPGFDIDVDTFLAERVKDETGPGDKLVVRVYGEDMDMLRTKAEQVRETLTHVDGLVAPEVQYPEVHPNLEIEPNLARAERHGLSPGEVRRAAATLLGGIEVGSLFEAQKVFDVVVWGTPEARHSLSAVENLLIDTPSGGHVRLKEVADTRIRPHSPVIRRDAVARFIDVDAEVRGRAFAAVAADAQGRIRQSVEFPLEYRAEVLNGQESVSERIGAVAVAAALGALLLMQAAFGSWSLAALVLLCLPVAALGGIAAASLFGELASLGSLLGVLAVLTLAVRNAMSLVGHYRHLEEQGEAFSPELVMRGTRERFAPIVGTALVAALALAPLAFLGNVAGLEILHVMAIAVLGGLLSSTAVSLLVLPSLYLGFGGAAEPDILAEEEAA